MRTADCGRHPWTEIRRQLRRNKIFFLETGAVRAVRAEGAFFEMPHPVMQKRIPDEAQFQDKLAWDKIAAPSALNWTGRTAIKKPTSVRPIRGAP
jgi:hypothetical protein